MYGCLKRTLWVSDEVWIECLWGAIRATEGPLLCWSLLSPLITTAPLSLTSEICLTVVSVGKSIQVTGNRHDGTDSYMSGYLLGDRVIVFGSTSLLQNWLLYLSLSNIQTRGLEKRQDVRREQNLLLFVTRETEDTTGATSTSCKCPLIHAFVIAGVMILLGKPQHKELWKKWSKADPRNGFTILHDKIINIWILPKSEYILCTCEQGIITTSTVKEKHGGVSETSITRNNSHLLLCDTK